MFCGFAEVSQGYKFELELYPDQCIYLCLQQSAGQQKRAVSADHQARRCAAEPNPEALARYYYLGANHHLLVLS